MSRSKANGKASKHLKKTKTQKHSKSTRQEQPSRRQDADLLSLSEEVHLLQNTDQTSKFSSTLPFNPKEVSSWRTVSSALERTKIRWQWFITAQRMDVENHTILGTLSYLPREIRDTIYEKVLDSYCYDLWHDMVVSTGGPGEQRTVMRREVSCLNEWSWCVCCSSGKTSAINGCHQDECFNPQGRFGIRASSTLCDEFDRLFFAETVFKFDSPEALGSFLSHMSSTQPYLQRITLELLTPGCSQQAVWRRWMAAFRGHSMLLRGLKLIKFSLSLGHACRSWTEIGPPKVGSMEQAVGIVDVITKAARRSAPKVGFAIDYGNLYVDEERWLLGKVFSEVE